MKRTISVVGILVLLVGLSFISVAFRRPRAITGASTTVETLPDGYTLYHIENGSSQPITALAVVATRTEVAGTHTKDTSVRFFDSVLSPVNQPSLSPGQIYTVKLFGPNPPPSAIQSEIDLKAVIFADGSSSGDTEWVGRLLARRRAAYTHLQAAMSILSTAQQSNMSLQELQANIQAAKDSASTAAQLIEEKQVVGHIYGEIYTNLQNAAAQDAGKIPYDHIRNRFQSRVARLKNSRPSMSFQ